MKAKSLILFAIVTIIIASIAVVHYRSPYQRGRSTARADLAVGHPRYFLIGEPVVSPEFPIDDKLKQDYNISLVELGCCPVPHVSEHVKGYNEVIVESLGRQFGHDFIKKAFETDFKLDQEVSTNYER